MEFSCFSQHIEAEALARWRAQLERDHYVDTCSRLAEPGGVEWKDVGVARSRRIKNSRGLIWWFKRSLGDLGGEGGWAVGFGVGAPMGSPRSGGGLAGA